MDTAEKVVVFMSFDELTEAINKDKTTSDMLAQRYPVRFIMLNNFNEFKKLAIYMADNDVETLDLEILIDNGTSEENDLWITKDRLKNALKSCKKSTFVSPFSELVRFYNDEDFRGFFNEIMLLEDIHTPNKRIYIPLIGLQNRFTDFLNHFARIKESAPIWRYDAEPQSVEVYLSKYKDFKLPTNTIKCQLNTLFDWLRFWKVQAPQSKILCTSTPLSVKYKYSKPDNIFNFTKIENAYEFMTRFLDLHFPFEYIEEDNVYWEEMLKHINKEHLDTFSFRLFVPSYFNRVKYNTSDIINDWSDKHNPAFNRWLLKNYVLHTDFSQNHPYLRLCIECVDDLTSENELIKLIATRIAYGIPDDNWAQYAKERRRIIIENHMLFETTLADSDQEWLYEKIKELCKKTDDITQIIDICSGVFDFEKKLLMGWYAHHPDNKILINALEELYPDFAAYLVTEQPSVYTDTWAIDYIKEYKQAKLEDKYLGSIKDILLEKNHTEESFYKWYYDYGESHEVLSSLHPKSTDKIFWLDGLGIEFLSYLTYLFDREKSNIKLIHSQITRSKLPSSTDHNRFSGDNVIKFDGVDKKGHDYIGYRQYDTLIYELKELKRIVKEIVSICTREACNGYIVSDHGLSFLSRKVTSKKYSGKFEHEGRYVQTTFKAVSDTDYIVYRNEDDNLYYKIALTHASLGSVPIHQVHGGCTPEEVLVPLLVISNDAPKTDKKKYEVSILSSEIMLSDPIVEVKVIPEPKAVILTTEGKDYQMQKRGTKWIIKLNDITEGLHDITITPSGGYKTKGSINIIGISGYKSIDDLFDL